MLGILVYSLPIEGILSVAYSGIVHYYITDCIKNASERPDIRPLINISMVWVVQKNQGHDKV